MNASSPNVSSPTTFASTAAPENGGAQIAEAELIARCREGDLTAFDALVARHQNRIFSLCYWMLGHREEAADAAQDAFVRAFRSLSNFRSESSFGTWLHRIAVNVAIDASHRRKRAPLLYSDIAARGDDGEAGDIESLSADSMRGQSTPGASTPGGNEPAQAALRGERRDSVRRALARLPEHYRFALVLYDIQGHSYEEIAGALDLPLGTVKSRINRARLQLRNELHSERELFED